MSFQLVETILVVLCFNECARLKPDAFLGFLEEQAGAGFLFGNDGSEDGTRDVLEDMRAQAPDQTAPLRLEQNSGKAEPVRRSLLHVPSAESPSIANARFVGYWDADLATPLTALPLFLAEMEDRLGGPPADRAKTGVASTTLRVVPAAPWPSGTPRGRRHAHMGSRRRLQP